MADVLMFVAAATPFLAALAIVYRGLKWLLS